MPNNAEPPSNPNASYMLGEMHATIRSIDQNVTAMRAEFSELSRRMKDVEQEVAEIQAERGTLMPEYLTFVRHVRDHMREYGEWKSRVEGRIEGGSKVAGWSGKIANAVLGVLLTIILFLVGNMWMDQRTALEHRPAATTTR